MMKLFRSKKGFTLVELIVVIVIIAILAAALVTSLIGYVEKAGNTTALVEANDVYVATQAYISENVGTGKITAPVSATTTEMITAINDYLGTTGKIASTATAGVGAITALTTNDKGTITAFTYTSTNSRTVTYAATASQNVAAGWSVKKA